MYRNGSQSLVLGVSALVVIGLSLGSIGAWRAYTGTAPEQERANAARLLQTRASQASEELATKTKGLETSQQETIDQVQAVTEQLQVVKRLLTAQQAQTQRLTEKVGGVAESVDTLRQSFASSKSTDASAPTAKKRSYRKPTRTKRTKSKN